MRDNTVDLWEHRSKLYGTSPKGVLPKSFPSPVNNYLHVWMFEQIKQVLPGDKKIKVLDVGCGYGRLSKEVLKKNPKSSIIGIDISDTYVKLYNSQLSPRGKAIKGDIRSLPFKSSSFDIAFMVTTLMYITKRRDQEKVIRELFRVLKPDGKLVVIERNPYGHFLVTLGGLIGRLRGREFKEIPAVSFKKDYMCNLIDNSGGMITNMRGIPVWSLLLPLLIIVSKINLGFAGGILKIISLADEHFSWLLTPSLYIAYIVKNKK